MAVNVSYPGVYIQEVPSGSRAIAGVPTSIGAFVGYTARGPVDDAIQIFSFADFERTFGGLNVDSDLSYAVNHFFLNGGGTCWIVRIAENAAAASVELQTQEAVPATTLTVTASSEGAFGNSLILAVDYATSDPVNTFNLTVTEMAEQNGRLVALRTETHRNLSMNDRAATYAVATVNAASDLIQLSNANLVSPNGGISESGFIDDAIVQALDNDTRTLSISVDGSPFHEFDLFPLDNNNLVDFNGFVTALQPLINAIDGIAGVTVAANAGGDGIVVTSGSTGRNSVVQIRNASRSNAAAALSLGPLNGGRETSGAAELRPAQTGTTGARIEDYATVAAALAVNDPVTVNLVDPAAPAVVIASATIPLNPVPATLNEARAQIQAGLDAETNSAFSGAIVSIVDDALNITPGGTGYAMGVTTTGAGADELFRQGGGLDFVNVTAYQPGVGPSVAAQVAGINGSDGNAPIPPAGIPLITGNRALKTGIFALEDADIFNVLCLPGTTDIAALGPAVTYAEERRSMIIVDIDENVDTLDEARDWVNDGANTSLKSNNAAAYFPRIRLADPLQQNRLRPFPNSGLMAGLWARTDNLRGIWKAPAGIEAGLRGVQALDYVLSDPENGVLNPLGLNCLRTFPVYGTVAWGARTLVGADARASEWKYIPVRRTALFIEESLYRGTQFVVFEPNDEPLWAQIRLSVGSFMNNLFRQGAFQGATPQEAYFVRCDSTTTTQADIDLGIVNILVGFAPLKPAEFVVISLQQIAGQGQ